MLGDSEEGIKVIVVGDGNVGKTCMLRRFVKGDFTEFYKKTIGTEYLEKDVFLRSSNTTVKLMLWDTAGQEVFSSLTQAYYRGSSAAVLAFSTVDRDSFLHIEQWKQKVESVCGAITMILCQTKVDLSHEASITNEEAEKLAAELNLPLYRVSAKDDFNITQLFELTAQLCVEGNTTTKEVEPGHEQGSPEGEVPGPSEATTSAPTGGAVSPSSPPAGKEKEAEKSSHPHKTNASKTATTTGSKKVTLNEPQATKQHKKKKMKCSLA